MFLYSRNAFDVVDEVIFTPDVLSTLSTRQFSLPMCFRRCRRDNFYSRRAFDVIDGIIFTPGMLSTLSTRHFSLPMCFRRCRRDNFYSRCVFDAVDGIIFTPDVQSEHHFGLFLLFGYDFIDYSGFSRAFPLPHLRPRMDMLQGQRG